MMIRLLVFAAALGAWSVAVLADADYPLERSLDSSLDEHKPRDYYSHDPEIRNLLRVVEAYHMGPGLRKIQERRHESAYGEFDFILRYYPNHPRALALMGDLCVVMKRQTDGERYFERALSLFPNMTRSAKGITMREYGKFLYRFEDYPRARDMLEKSVALDDFPGETHYYLGLAYLAEKDYVRANFHAQTAYSKNFPLTELRDKLLAATAWEPSALVKPASEQK